MPTPLTGAKDLVDEALLRALDVDASDADYTAWTARGTSYAQNVAQEVWEYADWEFRRASGDTIVIAAVDAGSGFMPTATYAGLGEQGAIFVLSPPRRPPLSYMNAIDFYAVREGEGRTGTPEYYTIDGYVAGAGYQLRVYPTPLVDTTLVTFYQKRRPDLSYQNPGGLDQFPPEFWDVMLFGLEDLLAMNGGSSASLEQYSPRFRKALNRLKAERVTGHNALERVGARGVRRYRCH